MNIAQYEYLNQDELKIGVAETIVKESPLLAALPMLEIAGNSYKYDMELTEAGISFYESNGTWGESTPTVEQRTVNLAIVGGDVDVDQFRQQTNKNQNVEATVMSLKAKALANELEKQFIFGRTCTQSSDKQYKGLLRIIAGFETEATTDLDALNNSQVIKAHATSAALTLDMIDELIDAVRPAADFLMMSRRMRRKLNSLARAAGTNLTVGQNEWGKFIQIYNELPIYINDHILNNVPDSTTSVLDISAYNLATARTGALDNSLIFAVHVGDNGISGIHSGGIQIEDVGIVQNKDAKRKRIKAYMGIAGFNKLSAAVLINSLDTAL